MCFSPQRRAIFRHQNFKKWSKHAVFCTFWLQNVHFATAACNFSTSELQKVLRSWRVLYIFTSKCAFRHSGVQFLLSLLNTYLRTRRFNRPTFGLTGHTNHWKNTAFRDFSNIWRGCILLSSDFRAIASSFGWLDYSTLLFNCPYCRKFLFKLPSITAWSTVQTCNRYVCTPMLPALHWLGQTGQAWVPGLLLVKIRVMMENRHRKKKSRISGKTHMNMKAEWKRILSTGAVMCNSNI